MSKQKLQPAHAKAIPDIPDPCDVSPPAPVDPARLPWREVVHIAYQSGARGGEYWLLTLECGHQRAVHIPPFRPEKANYSRRPEAPKRCRCLLCTIV